VSIYSNDYILKNKLSASYQNQIVLECHQTFFKLKQNEWLIKYIVPKELSATIVLSKGRSKVAVGRIATLNIKQCYQ
jgi:hypothetical protein